MCWGKAKKQIEQKQPQGQKTPGRTFYWTGNNPNMLCNFLGEVIQKGFDFTSPVFRGKVHFLVTEDEEDYFGYQRLNYEVVDRTDVEEITGTELFDAIKSIYCWLDDQSELQSINGVQYYRDVFVPKKVVGLLDGKYSEAFSLLLAERSKYSRDLIERALALYDEGLSPDMRAYILLVNNENKRTG